MLGFNGGSMNSNSEMYYTKDLRNRLEVFISGVTEISNKLNGDIYNLRNKLNQYVKDIPNFLEAGFSSSRNVLRVKNFLIARESLEQIKTYLSMLKTTKIASTQNLIKQIEEINKIIENQIKNNV